MKIFLPTDFVDRDPIDVNRARTRWLLYLLFGCGLISYYMLPIWAGIFTDEFGFSPKQVGLLLSADMAANTVAAFLARYWIHRSHWRNTAAVAIAVAALANALCALAGGFSTLLILRYVAGFGAGAMFAFVYAGFAACEKPDKEFAFALAMSVVIGAIFINGAPPMVAQWGSGSAFVAIALATSVPLLLVKAMPISNPLSSHPDGEEDKEPSESTGAVGIAVWVGLVAVAAFFLSMDSIWSFMERVGDAEGFDTQFITLVLTIALGFSFVGAMVAAAVEGRASRLTFIFSSYVCLFIAIYSIGNHPAAMVYAVAICVYNFFYNFAIPFQSGWIASADETGRTVVLLPVFQGIGLSAGPFLASLVVSNGDYTPISRLSIAFLIVSIALFFAMDRADRPRLEKRSEEA